MAVKVRITPEAELDLTAIGDYIARDSPGNALEFLTKLRTRIAELRDSPGKHGKADEAGLVDVDLRQMLHGPYRILYTFDERDVTIHGVRHGARQPMRRDELPRTL